MAWYAAGQRRVKQFPSYSGAKTYADGLVKDLASGSQATALSPTQARDALAAIERLQGYFQRTGRKVSLLRAVSEYVEASGRLNGNTLGEAVDGFLGTVVNAKRKDIARAVEDFIAADEPRTKAANGERAQLSAKYAYNRAIMLRRFSAALPGNAVCDLSKEVLNVFLKSRVIADFSAKSRNHHRAAIKQFLQWAVRNDYLSPAHRLNEADGMRP